MSLANKNSIIKVIFYFSGLFLLSLGIVLTIVVKLGTSPFDALLVALNNAYGLTVGSWEYIVGLVLVLVNALIQWKKPDILAMGTAFITGAGIDFWLFVFRNCSQVTLIWTKIALLLLGIIFVGVGIAVYLQAEFAPSPMDCTMLVIRDKLGIGLSTAKYILMIFFLILAYLFDGPIYLGTIVMILLTGPIIGLFYPWMEHIKNKTLGVSKCC